MTRYYPSPELFKQALEERVRRAALHDGVDMGRFRQLLLFDRFLARVFEELPERVVLKGGVALELRLGRARTTRDVDLQVMGGPAGFLEALQRAGRRDLGDALTFIVVPDAASPTLQGIGMVSAGRRFRAEARIAGNIYGMPFGVDAAFGDVLTTQAEAFSGTTFFNFVGVPPAKLRVYPREAHVAEKLHAYTLPRKRKNSRVKDLPDLALLGQTGGFAAAQLRDAIQNTFELRKTHAVPSVLPTPPANWEPRYARMASEDTLPWSTLEALEQAVRAFLDPLLGGAAGDWDPKAWVWTG